MFRLTRISKWPSQLHSSWILRESRQSSALASTSVQSKDGRITLSTGIFGHLSESSVICNVGGSVVHAALNAARSNDPNEPFLPLTVDYRARQYAFGVIPGSRQRREAHGSSDEILVSRFIDRAVRPLFPKGYVNEVQLTVTNHAADGIHDPTVAAVNAASLALMHSKQPWQGPIGCVRIGCIDGQLKIDPTLKEMETSTLDFLYAGTSTRTLMIETAASQVPEATIKEAMRLAHTAVQDIIDIQNKFLEKVAPQPQQLLSVHNAAPVVEANAKRQPFLVSPELKAAVKAMIYEEALAMYAAGGTTKEARGRSEGKLRGDTLKALAEDPVWGLEHIVSRKMAVDSVMNSAFRAVLLRGDARIDGRGLNQLRQITSFAPVMPSVHGSSYFTRGDTHVVSSVTLGSKKDALEVLPIAGSAAGELVPNYFMLHYDFPPYCTGELGNATSLNRRMVGHGKLAERAVRPVLPSVDDFPYTVRVYSECTSSNGSSSMASACGASLALMDAGVPLKAAVAGLSVGLITHEQLPSLLPLMTHNPALRAEDGSRSYVLLKDILGTEDHNGDMDFKIAGTSQGVTAIQLDVKLEGGVPLFMLEEALDVAREGRLEILNTMNQTLSQSNALVKPQAPKAVLIKYDEDRRQMLAGPGGEMVRHIQEMYQCEIDYSQPGLCYIYGKDARLVAEAESLVRDIAVQVKDGDILLAQVLEIKDFGLMMKINRAQEAILHMSDISYDENLLKTPLDKLFQVGQRFHVQVYSSEKATGIVKVSRKLLKDPKAEKDTIEVSLPPEINLIESLPTFPVLPPRKYSRDYFSHSVSSEADNEKAMQRYNKIVNPVVKEIPVVPVKGSSGSSGNNNQYNNQNNRRQQKGTYDRGNNQRMDNRHNSNNNNNSRNSQQQQQQQQRHQKVESAVLKVARRPEGHNAREDNQRQLDKFSMALKATARQPKSITTEETKAPTNSTVQRTAGPPAAEVSSSIKSTSESSSDKKSGFTQQFSSRGSDNSDNSNNNSISVETSNVKTTSVPSPDSTANMTGNAASAGSQSQPNDKKPPAKPDKDHLANVNRLISAIAAKGRVAPAAPVGTVVEPVAAAVATAHKEATTVTAAAAPISPSVHASAPSTAKAEPIVVVVTANEPAPGVTTPTTEVKKKTRREATQKEVVPVSAEQVTLSTSVDEEMPGNMKNKKFEKKARRRKKNEGAASSGSEATATSDGSVSMDVSHATIQVTPGELKKKRGRKSSKKSEIDSIASVDMTSADAVSVASTVSESSDEKKPKTTRRKKTSKKKNTEDTSAAVEAAVSEAVTTVAANMA